MFRLIEVLNEDELSKLRDISQSANYVDGKISNPNSTVKNNLQMHDNSAMAVSGKLLFEALVQNPEFREFAFPAKVAPPMMTRYHKGMNYGVHADSAIMQLQNGPLRADISCTIFLNAPEDYEGGALRLRVGDKDLRFKEPAGMAVLYPSTTLHEVETVTKGERHVAITFIQSQIADEAQRTLLFELNEVAALEGNNMSHENFTRLQSVQMNLSRMWLR